MAALYPQHAAKFVTVTNGYDDPPESSPRTGHRLCIVFAGTLYLGRDPRPLFRAVAALARRTGIGPDSVGVVMMGDVVQALGRPTRDLAREAGAEPFLELRPRGTRAEAEALMAAADVLVILPWGNALAIPAKLFDYARHAAWLLAFGPRESGLGRLLEGTDADLVPEDDVEAAVAALERRLAMHREGRRAEPLGRDPRFSRRQQARVLLDSLAPLVDGAARSR
jgi:hypothetical protein